ncbi:hypothetical protein GGQ80_000454 [Sphingomonas jinjuensis]|uniref:PilZ domain-containing protein n=1 Tax=Sphingomonas jinjuensis TaxID=535907 RepID=A0A840FF10_9SPHN|nr:PilZ domain-containing protein [Sphingomonas jinjuensis]MBB4152578.1 hypothetical protein [Sphingomonas jinjuensis]
MAMNSAPDLRFTTVDPVTLGEQRRQGKRHRTVLLIGRVSRGDVESACLVHDISKNGLMARFTVAPSVGDRLRIEVRGLPEVSATIRWVKEYKAGLEFDEEQDLTRVFRLRADDGHVARTPRFAMNAVADLKIGDRPMAVDLIDISPGGVKLAGVEGVEVGQAGRVLLPDLAEPVFGTVCWVREDRLGFRFVTPLPLTALSRVLGC